MPIAPVAGTGTSSNSTSQLVAASVASVLGIETYTAVFGAIAGFLALGIALFRFLPQPGARTSARVEPSQSAP